MRTMHRLAAFALLVSLGACARKSEQAATASGNRSKAVASAPKPNLEIAPQTYKRMRFVSDLEQTRGAVPIKQASASRLADRPARPLARSIALDPVVSVASRQMATVTTVQVMAPQPAAVMASLPAPELARAPSAPSDGGGLDHAGESSDGGRFGGLSTHVVIRGGRAGDDKCDPRTDARVAGILDGRPDSRMPLVPTRSVFGGSRF